MLQLTSQDKTAQVIQKALDKHHLEHMDGQNFGLTQVISQHKGQGSSLKSTNISKKNKTHPTFPLPFSLLAELVIPDKANVFYAMSTTANFDFVLRQQRKGQKKVLRATASLSRLVK